MTPSLSALSLRSATAVVGCPGDGGPRRRSERVQTTKFDAPTPVRALEAVELDVEGRVVYVDLRPRREGDEQEAPSATLSALQESLTAITPPTRTLERLSPINRGRRLVEIEDVGTLELFRLWLLATLESRPVELRSLLAPLGRRLRLLGAQWIVPCATLYEPRVLPQAPHTDVDAKGEVVAVALSVNGNRLNTLIDATARIDAAGRVLGGGGFGSAQTSVFAYDTGAVHAGPGIPHVEPPFPLFITDRVFFLLCAADLDPARIAQHRRDNGLRGRADLTIEVMGERSAAVSHDLHPPLQGVQLPYGPTSFKDERILNVEEALPFIWLKE